MFIMIISDSQITVLRNTYLKVNTTLMNNLMKMVWRASNAPIPSLVVS